MTRDKETTEVFKKKALECLSTYSLHDLRKYGRYIKLQRPTDMKKKDLLKKIIEVLCEETSTFRTRRGAPVKNTTVPVSMILQLEELKKELFGEEVFIEASDEMEIIQEVPVEEETEEEQQDIDTESEYENPVRLRFSIDMQKLTREQRYKLLDFLNSL